MTISLYGTTELIQVQQRLADLPDGFWRNLFPRVITSDREEIMFEVADIDNRKLAPFVAPNVQGRVMRSQGYAARSFRPAYTKPKSVIDPSKAIPRMMGEPLLGGLSIAQRFDAHVVKSMRDQRMWIERLWDWMASKAIIDGMVTVVGEDYPSQTVDFLRDASLTATLLTTARWDQLATADPLQDLADMVDLSFPLGNAPITDIGFGTNAWKYFLKNAAVLDLLNNQKRGSTSEFSRTVLNGNSNYQLMGFVDGGSGRFNLYRYSNWYSETQADGSLIVRQFLDPNVVCGYGPAVDGAAMFGAIMDADANFQTEATIFPKMWRQPDPSVVYTMSQSAPLFVPLNPNNSFKLTVIT
jgi:hypothetical protein